MTPLDRLRIEKAASDCGFEMTPTLRDGGMELRSARFPETVLVKLIGPSTLMVRTSCSGLIDEDDGAGVITVNGFGMLYEVLRTAAAHARTLPNRVADAFRHETTGMPRATEAERWVVQRVGQKLFRGALLDYWQGRCCVTELAIPELLRASHIKPWAACATDDERLDVFNGLLLAPHLDALFDGGWISFAADGQLLISEALAPQEAERLGVRGHWSVHNLKPAHGPYLAFHRAQVFRAPACAH
jgi:putative restriction endonuclease